MSFLESALDRNSIALLDQDARVALLDRALEQAPHDVATVDTWYFAYGAMLEGPPFTPISDEVVVCEGWSRKFCLSDPLLRGTAEHPGVVLGLQAGGRCAGVAWRLLAQTAREDLIKVFKAELRLPFYKASWAKVRPQRGETFALTLLADEASPLFEPTLNKGEVVARLSTSHGEAGPNADYLKQVVTALDHRGIPDLDLNRLLRELPH